MNTRFVGKAAAVALAAGLMVGASASGASAAGDFSYSGTRSVGGSTVYVYTDSSGGNAYFGSWQGMFWSRSAGGTQAH